MIKMSEELFSFVQNNLLKGKKYKEVVEKDNEKALKVVRN